MGYLAKIDRINQGTLKNALLWGTTMASFTVEDFSINRFLKVTKKDIDKRYEDLHRIIGL